MLSLRRFLFETSCKNKSLHRFSGPYSLDCLTFYAAPIGASFCPEIRAFTASGARFLQPFPKSLVTVEYYSNTKVAVNSR